MRETAPSRPKSRARRSRIRSLRVGRAWFRRIERSERKKKVEVMAEPVTKRGLRELAPMSEMKARPLLRSIEG